MTRLTGEASIAEQISVMADTICPQVAIITMLAPSNHYTFTIHHAITVHGDCMVMMTRSNIKVTTKITFPNGGPLAMNYV